MAYIPDPVGNSQKNSIKKKLTILSALFVPTFPTFESSAYQVGITCQVTECSQHAERKMSNYTSVQVLERTRFLDESS